MAADRPISSHTQAPSHLPASLPIPHTSSQLAGPCTINTNPPRPISCICPPPSLSLMSLCHCSQFPFTRPPAQPAPRAARASSRRGTRPPAAPVESAPCRCTFWCGRPAAPRPPPGCCLHRGTQSINHTQYLSTTARVHGTVGMLEYMVLLERYWPLAVASWMMRAGWGKPPTLH